MRRPRVRSVLAQAALCLAAAAVLGCESALLSEVVDVAAEGPAPPTLFSRVTTADTVVRVFLLEGARPDDDVLAATLEGAEIVLRVDGVAHGPLALRTERVFEGLALTADTTPFVDRGVYAIAAPANLVAGTALGLDVRLPDGTAFALSQNLPPAAAARIYEVQPPEVDTIGERTFTLGSTQVVVKVARPRTDAVNYYRLRARQTFFLDGAPVLTLERGTALSELEEDDTRRFPYDIFSDEGALGDTIQQNVAIDTGLPFFYQRGFGNDDAPPRPDSSLVEVAVTTLPRSAVDYYVDLSRSNRASLDFFAEPVALTSQAADAEVIAHLVAETWGRERLVFRGVF